MILARDARVEHVSISRFEVSAVFHEGVVRLRKKGHWLVQESEVGQRIKKESLDDCDMTHNGHGLCHEPSAMFIIHDGIWFLRTTGDPNDKIARLDNYRWRNCCGGLYQLPIAA